MHEMGVYTAMAVTHALQNEPSSTTNCVLKGIAKLVRSSGASSKRNKKPHAMQAS